MGTVPDVEPASYTVSGPLGPGQVISSVTASGGAMTGATGSLTPDGSTAPFVPAETRLLYGPPLGDVSGGQPETHHEPPRAAAQRQAEAAASLREQSESPYRGPGALGGDQYQSGEERY